MLGSVNRNFYYQTVHYNNKIVELNLRANILSAVWKVFVYSPHKRDYTT